LIRFIHKDLKNTCNLNSIFYNVKSHSFRIHLISSLLKLTSVQNVADILSSIFYDHKKTFNFNKMNSETIVGKILFNPNIHLFLYLNLNTQEIVNYKLMLDDDILEPSDNDRLEYF
jgi:hypothetical protein